MALLEIPRCPNCGHQVDPADLRREFARRRSLFDRTKWGIRCSSCKFVSKIRRARAQVVSLVILATAATLIMSLADTLHGLGADGQRVAFIGLIGVVVLIQLRWVPLFIQLEAPAPGELLRPCNFGN